MAENAKNPSVSSQSQSIDRLPKPNSSASKSKKIHYCPICDESINDKKQESIFCDGQCATWLHHQCAGLSKASLAQLGSSDAPFYCLSCTVAHQQREIASLKAVISNLSSELASFKNELNVARSAEGESLASAVSESSTYAQAVSQKQKLDQTNDKVQSTSTGSSGHYHSTGLSYDKKFKLVFFGVTESPRNTPRYRRNKADLDSIVSAISSVESSITEGDIRDCSRLGRYNESQHSRPIVVHFNKAADVVTLLSKRGQASPPFIIKPFMSPEERVSDSILLRQRWSLIQSGTDRNCIKIRTSCLFVNNVLHSKVKDSKYHPVTPSDTSHSVSVNDANADVADGTLLSTSDAPVVSTPGD